MTNKEDLADLGRRIDACIAKHGITEADFARVRANPPPSDAGIELMVTFGLYRQDYDEVRRGLVELHGLMIEQEQRFSHD